MQPKNSKPDKPDLRNFSLFGEGKEEGRDWPERTFYESLILAQDERWRRA